MCQRSRKSDPVYTSRMILIEIKSVQKLYQPIFHLSKQPQRIFQSTKTFKVATPFDYSFVIEFFFATRNDVVKSMGDIQVNNLVPYQICIYVDGS